MANSARRQRGGGVKYRTSAYALHMADGTPFVAVLIDNVDGSTDHQFRMPVEDARALLQDLSRALGEADQDR